MDEKVMFREFDPDIREYAMAEYASLRGPGNRSSQRTMTWRRHRRRRAMVAQIDKDKRRRARDEEAKNTNRRGAMIRVRLTCIPPDGGIPPANRRRLSDGRSSMRAAARQGMSHLDRPWASDRRPAPDEQARRQRDMYRRALAARRQQLERLLADLADAADECLQQEAGLLREELARLEGFLW